jgi:hypothetical protein
VVKMRDTGTDFRSKHAKPGRFCISGHPGVADGESRPDRQAIIGMQFYTSFVDKIVSKDVNARQAP